MDKFNFARLVAGERKNEIDHYLAVRHMLKEADDDTFKVSKTRALVLRFALAVIVISVFAFILLG